MDQYELKRTGDRNLFFSGEVAGEATTHHDDATRWHELALYRTAGGKLVVAVQFVTRWQGETDHHSAAVVEDAPSLADWLKRYDPCGYLMGYPPGAAFDQKRERLTRDLTLRYQAAVSELLSTLEPERVD